MTDSPKDRILPTNLSQMLTVTRYELLKHMRSKRLVGCIAVILLIVCLIYFIPPSLGHPYTGHVTQEMQIQPYGPFASYSLLNHSDVVNASIRITVNGADLPQEMNWSYNQSMNAVVFFQNLVGQQVVADFDFKEPAQDFARNFMQFATTLIIICITFFGADALVSEYQNRTAYLLFPNPIKREVMFLGKFLASVIATVMMVGLFYLLIAALSIGTIGDATIYLMLSFGFAVLFLTACLALAYFISSIMKGSTGAIILTFFLMMMILPIVQSVGMLSGMKMWFLLTFAGDVASASIRWDDYPVDSSQTMQGFTFYNYYPEPTISAIVLVAYIAILMLISMFLFKRKQLTG